MAIAYSFQAPKNNVIVVDRTRSADPISYKCFLKIRNQGTTRMYYKLRSSGAWAISSPTDGELGYVESGATKYFTITLSRTLPTSDTVETIDFTLETYSDPGYSNLIESTSFSMTAIIADIHSWPSYTKYDFDDGTTQGWSLGSGMSISDAKSITPGGYSVRFYDYPFSTSLTRTITVPNTSRAVLVLYFNLGSDQYVNYVAIKVNGNEIYRAGLDVTGVGVNLATGPTSTWDMIGVDLSDYAGQTISLSIEILADRNLTLYIDDIIIAGTNAL